MPQNFFQEVFSEGLQRAAQKKSLNKQLAQQLLMHQDQMAQAQAERELQAQRNTLLGRQLESEDASRRADSNYRAAQGIASGLFFQPGATDKFSIGGPQERTGPDGLPQLDYSMPQQSLEVVKSLLPPVDIGYGNKVIPVDPDDAATREGVRAQRKAEGEARGKNLATKLQIQMLEEMDKRYPGILGDTRTKNQLYSKIITGGTIPEESLDQYKTRLYGAMFSAKTPQERDAIKAHLAEIYSHEAKLRSSSTGGIAAIRFGYEQQVNKKATEAYQRAYTNVKNAHAAMQNPAEPSIPEIYTELTKQAGTGGLTKDELNEAMNMFLTRNQPKPSIIAQIQGAGNAPLADPNAQ